MLWKQKCLGLEKKLDSMKDSALLSHIREQIVDMHVPYSFCHGDLTFANIIFHSNRLYFIDFLDSFIDSYLIDFAKLKQDLFYFWNLKIQSINFRIFDTAGFSKNNRDLKKYVVFPVIFNLSSEFTADK